MHRSRGASLSVLFAVLIPALLLCVGLGVDGAAKVAAARRAEGMAASAARSGVDAASAERIASRQEASQIAVRAAEENLRAAGIEGSARVSGNGVLLVDTRISTPTVFMSLIGIVEVSGKGHAEVSLRKR